MPRPPIRLLVVVSALALAAACTSYKVVRDGEPNRALLDELQARTAELRGLPFKAPVGARVYTKAELSAYIESQVDDHYTQAELRGLERALVRLGLLEETVPYFETIKRVVREGAAGFYDPEVKEFRLIEDFSGGGGGVVGAASFITQRDIVGEVTVVHELDHALQDQHFDLLQLLPERLPMKDADAYTARKALVESEANVVGFAHLYDIDLGDPARRTFLLDALADQELRAADLLGEQIPGVPRFVLREVTFQYFGAMSLLRATMDRGGWDAVNLLYEKLPESTEQLLWPAKYFSVEPDRPLRLPLVPDEAELLAGHAPVFTNVMGELGLRILFEPHMELADAWTAAAGWGGDRYDVVEPGAADGEGPTVLLWRTLWDTETDAQELARAYGHVLQAKHAGRARQKAFAPGSVTELWHIDASASEDAPGLYTPEPQVAAIAVEGRAVAIVEGARRDSEWETLLDGLWGWMEPLPEAPRVGYAAVEIR